MAARSTEREQFLADVIIGAVEGGTGYWAAVVAYGWEGLPAADVHAVLVPDDDETDAKVDALRVKLGRKPSPTEAVEAGFAYRVDIDTIAKGLGFVKDLPSIQPGMRAGIGSELRRTILDASRENDAGEIDSNAADVIVQAALFGEIVYG